MMDNPPGTPPLHYSLSGLATALTVLLALNAATTVATIAVPGLKVLEILLFLPLIPVFIVWFYRARKNADGRGWHQRRSPGWAIGGWFVPVVALWFPYQIMADVWQAGLPAKQRGRPAWQPITWWACWLLGWLTGVHYANTSAGTYHGVSVSILLGSTVASKVFDVAAAIAAILVIRAVSSHGVGREAQPGQAWTN